MCYRYTNPLCDKHGYYYTQCYKNVKSFFPFICHYFLPGKTSLPGGRGFIHFPRERACFSVPHCGYSEMLPSRPRPGALSKDRSIPARFADAAESAHGFFPDTPTPHRGIRFTLIDHTGSTSVHDHLHKVFPGHRKRLIAPGCKVHVRPVFVMMAISALMVHPRLTVPLFLPLCGIGASCALIVPGANTKLRRGIFGQVMGQSLPVKPYPEAAVPDQPAMPCNRLKMLPRLHVITLSLLLLILYVIPRTNTSPKRITPIMQFTGHPAGYPVLLAEVRLTLFSGEHFRGLQILRKPAR